MALIAPCSVGAQTVPAATLRARPANISAGHGLRLTGQLGAFPAGTVLSLDASPYPFRHTTPLKRIDPSAAASFAITVWPDRTTAYSLSAPDGTTLARTVVGVLGRTLIKAHALTLGRARVTLVIFHPRDLPWNGARVRWWFASGHGPYRAAPDSRTRRLSPFVTTVRTTIALPAGGYRFRACFDVPKAQALLDPRRSRG
ncbi:MAG TPA: hypothetical protein VII87_04885, partial [Solirubrobacteraceae bacterium]